VVRATLLTRPVHEAHILTILHCPGILWPDLKASIIWPEGYSPEADLESGSTGRALTILLTC